MSHLKKISKTPLSKSSTEKRFGTTMQYDNGDSHSTSGSTSSIRISPFIVVVAVVDSDIGRVGNPDGGLVQIGR
jgi:hypothetical protein